MFDLRVVLWHAGLPADSQLLSAECFPNGMGSKAIYIDYEFAAKVPLFKSGPRKGQENYAKAEGKSHHQVLIRDEAAIRERYEAETGNCSYCCGDGKVACGWSREDGTKYKPCERCNGTVKPGQVGPQRAQPASVGRIEAETATAKRQLELLNT